MREKITLLYLSFYVSDKVTYKDIKDCKNHHLSINIVSKLLIKKAEDGGFLPFT